MGLIAGLTVTGLLAEQVVAYERPTAGLQAGADQGADPSGASRWAYRGRRLVPLGRGSTAQDTGPRSHRPHARPGTSAWQPGYGRRVKERGVLGRTTLK